jgi:hypothetical protein
VHELRQTAAVAVFEQMLHVVEQQHRRR